MNPTRKEIVEKINEEVIKTLTKQGFKHAEGSAQFSMCFERRYHTNDTRDVLTKALSVFGINCTASTTALDVHKITLRLRGELFATLTVSDNTKTDGSLLLSFWYHSGACNT